VLSAYVRGCGGTVTDWEERWRTLTRSPALTLLPTRDAGGSDAAAAGARVGSVSLAADAHDPAIIMAALGRVANGIAPEPAPARSLFTPASAAKVAASAPPVLEQASVFAAAPAATSAPAAASAASSAPAVSSMPRSLTPDPADVAPDPADVAGATAASGTARVPGGAGTQGRALSAVKPVSTAGRAPNARRPAVSKPLIVAVVLLVCLAAIIWALFS
jgi:cobalamin biosynthesis Mg chelatase CobN